MRMIAERWLFRLGRQHPDPPSDDYLDRLEYRLRVLHGRPAGGER